MTACRACVFEQCRHLAADVRRVVHSMAVDACVSVCVVSHACRWGTEKVVVGHASVVSWPLHGLTSFQCLTRQETKAATRVACFFVIWVAVCGVQNTQQHLCCLGVLSLQSETQSWSIQRESGCLSRVCVAMLTRVCHMAERWIRGSVVLTMLAIRVTAVRV
jgi:hypothetical protein